MFPTSGLKRSLTTSNLQISSGKLKCTMLFIFQLALHFAKSSIIKTSYTTSTNETRSKVPASHLQLQLDSIETVQPCVESPARLIPKHFNRSVLSKRKFERLNISTLDRWSSSENKLPRADATIKYFAIQ